MSFILDALKKLEQKKQNGEVPDLLTVHASIQQEPRKRSFWPLIILVALLLNAAIIAGWLRPWEEKVHDFDSSSPAVEDKEASAPVTHAEHSTDTVLHGTAPGSKEKPVESAEAAAPSSAPRSGPPAVVEEPSDPGSRNPQAGDLKGKETEETADAAAAVEGTESDEAAHRLELSKEGLLELKKKIQEEKEAMNETNSADLLTGDQAGPADNTGTPEFSRLPASVREELPEITINAHIYSNNPGSRLVNINGTIVRENESISGGLSVYEITENGIIFDYHGLRFLKRAF